MEAKDKQKVLQQIQEQYPSIDPEMDVDWKIVEIAFKAGAKKVVEFVNENREYSNFPGIWQAFLKGQEY